VPRLGAGIPAIAWVLCAVLPLLQLTISATFPVVPQIREAFGLNYSEVGVFLASLGFARLLFDLPAGQIATRYPGRRLLWMSGGVIFTVCALAAVASEYWQLLAARVVLGTASAVNQAVILSWLVTLSGPRNRGLVMGISEAGFSIMVVFSPIVAGLLAEALSWRTPFVMGAVAAVVGLALILLGTRGHAGYVEPTVGEAEAAPSFGRLLPVGGALLGVSYVLTYAIFFGRQALTAAYLPALGGDVLGLSALSLGLAISGMSLGSIAATLLGSTLADRLGRAALVLPGFVVLLAVQLALVLVRDVPTYFALAWLQAASAGVNGLAPSLVGDALPPAYRGLGMAGYRMVADFAILAGPLAAGVALDHVGVHGAWVVICGNTALCAAVALGLGLRKPAR
jgi:MFS family permease